MHRRPGSFFCRNGSFYEEYGSHCGSTKCFLFLKKMIMALLSKIIIIYHYKETFHSLPCGHAFEKCFHGFRVVGGGRL